MKVQKWKVAVALLALGATGAGWKIKEADDARKNAGKLAANGTIEADEVEIGSQRAARLLEYRAEKGQSVKKGDVIAVLDTSELSAQVEQARGGVRLASAKLKELLRGTRSEQVLKAEAQVAKAQAMVHGAQRSVDNAKKGHGKRTSLKQAFDAALTQRDEAKSALDEAQARLVGAQSAEENATTELNTTLELRKNRDAARQSLEASEAQQRNASARLEQLQAGERPEVIAAAQAQVGQAVEQIRQSKEEADNAAIDLKRKLELFEGGAAAQADVDNAKTRNESARAKLGQAEQAKAQADSRLAELKNGTRKEEVDQAKAALQQAIANVEGGKRNLETTQQALELRLAAQGSLDSARATRIAAEAALSGAKSGLGGAELAVRTTRIAFEDALSEKQTLDTAQSEFESGNAELLAAEAQLTELKTGAMPEEIEQVRGQLLQARSQLALAKVQYEQSVIRAPRDGVITEHVAEKGEVVQPGATVARLVPLDEVYLTLYAPLPDLGKVKLGQSVEVAADTYPDKAYAGTIERISDTPEFTPRNVQTRDERVKLVFEVRVKVKNPQRELKPGMPADATIRL